MIENNNNWSQRIANQTKKEPRLWECLLWSCFDMESEGPELLVYKSPEADILNWTDQAPVRLFSNLRHIFTSASQEVTFLPFFFLRPLSCLVLVCDFGFIRWLDWFLHCFSLILDFLEFVLSLVHSQPACLFSAFVSALLREQILSVPRMYLNAIVHSLINQKGRKKKRKHLNCVT